jgi:hypothetical protein
LPKRLSCAKNQPYQKIPVPLSLKY